jgi:hypothetical protein
MSIFSKPVSATSVAKAAVRDIKGKHVPRARRPGR